MQQILTDQIHDNLITPFKRMFEAEEKAASQLVRHQASFVNDWLDVSAQARERLFAARTLTDHLSVPMYAGWELSRKWLDAVDRQYSVLMENGAARNRGVDNREDPNVASITQDKPAVDTEQQAATAAGESAETDVNADSAATRKRNGSAASKKGKAAKRSGAIESQAE